MSHSFTPTFRKASLGRGQPEPAQNQSGASGQTDRRVLVTGAAGRIGSYFAEHSADRYQLRLMLDETESGKDGKNTERPLDEFGEIVRGKLSDPQWLTEQCRGMDTVVHLAADPSPSATWDSLRQNNIEGAYNMMVAARAAGVRRLVYASSIHAVSGYAKDVQVKPGEAVNPGDLYGVSKCFGEALGRYMAEQEGLSVICIRIGAFQPRDRAEQREALNLLDAFVSHRDLTQLLRLCIENESLRFAIFQGLSNNRFKRMDISNARELVGYEPQDDFTALNEELRDLGLAEDIRPHNKTERGQHSGLRKELDRLE
jgi:nucleoside-diphosphate-sugar epimerase